MKTELIETLLQAEIISELDIDEAIKYASGTSLIEKILSLGCCSEDDVFKVIKNKLKLAVIEADALSNISQDVIGHIPRDLIEKHHFLPFNVDKATIHIAMFDPTQDSCLNEVGFFTDLRILPYGAMASDLTKALNKYFNMGLPEVFKYGEKNLAGSDAGEKPKPPLPGIPGGVPETKPPTPPEGKPEEGVVPSPPKPPTEVPKPPLPEAQPEPEPKPSVPSPEEKEGKLERFEDIEEMEEKEEISEEVIGKEQPEEEPAEVTEMLKKQKEVLEEKVPEEVKEEVEEEKKEGEEPVEIEEELPDFDEIVADVTGVRDLAALEKKEAETDVESIENGSNTEDILSAVITQMRRFSARSLVLFVKYDDLVAAVGFGPNIEENISSFKVSTSAQSIFKGVFDSKISFHGTPVINGHAEEFFEHFGGHKPRAISLVPVSIENSVFAIIYAEDTSASQEIEKIAKAMSSAFNRLLNSQE